MRRLGLGAFQNRGTGQQLGAQRRQQIVAVGRRRTISVSASSTRSVCGNFRRAPLGPSEPEYIRMMPFIGRGTFVGTHTCCNSHLLNVVGDSVAVITSDAKTTLQPLRRSRVVKCRSSLTTYTVSLCSYHGVEYPHHPMPEHTLLVPSQQLPTDCRKPKSGRRSTLAVICSNSTSK